MPFDRFTIGPLELVKKCLLLALTLVASCAPQPATPETPVPSPTATNTPYPLPEVGITPNYIQSDSDTLEVKLGQLFALRWDQSAHIQSENISVLHTTDIEWECPADAVCEVPLIATDYIEVILAGESLGVQKWQSEIVFGDYVLTTVRFYSGSDYRIHQFEIVLVVRYQDDVIASHQAATAETAWLDISSDCETPGDKDIWQFKARERNSPEVHMLGIREADGGKVDVYVERAEAPIILVLSAYESTDWHLHLDQDASLRSVILNGYKPHSVVGGEGVPLVDHSGYGRNIMQYVYVWNTNELAYKNGLAPAWVYQLEAITDAPLTSFAGCHHASEFTIR